MTPTRLKLADVLTGGNSSREALARRFDEAKAADDLAPLPAGTYRTRLISGELKQSRSGTPSYEMAFVVEDGEYRGRRLWRNAWLTEAAIPQAKRDVLKLGIKSLDQLEQPLPAVFLCDVRVVQRVDDDGTTRNAIRSFTVVGTVADPHADEHFAEPAT
jgi:hypothetical protein